MKSTALEGKNQPFRVTGSPIERLDSSKNQKVKTKTYRPSAVPMKNSECRPDRNRTL